VWINRTAYSDELEKKYREGLRKGRDDERDTLKPFPGLYAERMEYWKGRAKKELEPGPYRIVVFLVNGTQRREEFMDKADHDAAFAQWTDQDAKTIGLSEGEVIQRSAVVSVVPDDGEGHPDPYTPAEIEAWAKEKVEEEMKGWRVKEPEINDHQRHLEALNEAFTSWLREHPKGFIG
jgi:hypothetical protein